MIPRGLAIDNNSSVRVQALTRDEAAVLASKEHETRRNLTRLSRTAHRRSTKLFHGRAVHRRGDKGSPH